MSQTQFTKALATPLKLEGELTALADVPVIGLSAYDDGTGGVVVIHADALSTDQQQSVREVMAAHVADAPLVNYIELLGSTVSANPRIVTHDGTAFELSTTNAILYSSVYHLFNDSGSNNRIRFTMISGYTALLDITPSITDILFDASSSGEANVSYNFVPKGTGHLQENGVAVGLTGNPLSQFAATTSAQLAGVISDETGSGALVFATSPTLVTPALGTPASGVLTNCTGLPLAGMANLAQDQVIGRVTASTGVPETFTVTAAARTVLDDTDVASMLTTLNGQTRDATLTSLAAVAGVTGDILYASGTDTWTRLAKGTNAYVLTMGASVPYWNAALPVDSNNSIVYDHTDASKYLTFDISTFTTDTVRTKTWQNGDGTVAELERSQTWTGTNTFGSITMTEAKNIATGTTTGSIIAATSSQKIGFWGATPIVRGTAFTQTYATASHTHTQTTMTDPAAYGAGTNGYSTGAMASAIHAEVIALKANMVVVQNVLNGLIDDLQALGLAA